MLMKKRMDIRFVKKCGVVNACFCLGKMKVRKVLNIMKPVKCGNTSYNIVLLNFGLHSLSLAITKEKLLISK